MHVRYKAKSRSEYETVNKQQRQVYSVVSRAVWAKAVGATSSEGLLGLVIKLN